MPAVFMAAFDQMSAQTTGCRSKNISDLHHPHEEHRGALSNKQIFQSHSHFMGEIVMYNYPVLECLVAFAIVFLIGYLVADSGGKKATTAPGNDATHT